MHQPGEKPQQPRASPGKVIEVKVDDGAPEPEPASLGQHVQIALAVELGHQGPAHLQPVVQRVARVPDGPDRLLDVGPQLGVLLAREQRLEGLHGSHGLGTRASLARLLGLLLLLLLGLEVGGRPGRCHARRVRGETDDLGSGRARDAGAGGLAGFRARLFGLRQLGQAVDGQGSAQELAPVVHWGSLVRGSGAVRLELGRLVSISQARNERIDSERRVNPGGWLGGTENAVAQDRSLVPS